MDPGGDQGELRDWYPTRAHRVRFRRACAARQRLGPMARTRQSEVQVFSTVRVEEAVRAAAGREAISARRGLASRAGHKSGPTHSPRRPRGKRYALTSVLCRSTCQQGRARPAADAQCKQGDASHRATGIETPVGSPPTNRRTTTDGTTRSAAPVAVPLRRQQSVGSPSGAGV